MDDAKDQDRPRRSPDLADPGDLYRVLFEEAADGVFITDPHGQYVAVNQRGSELSGYSCEELLRMTITDLIPPEDLARDPIRMGELRQGKMVLGERRIRRKDGSLLTVEVSARMLPEGSLLAIVREITERKRAEEALRESEARYRTLFEANPHPMWVYDLETLAYLAVNDAALVQYGYSREEFLAMTIADMHPPEEVPRLMENIAHVGEQLVDKAGIWTHYRKNGSIIAVEVTSHVLDYRGRRAELVLANDITERVRAGEEREKLQAQLLQAQKMESVGRLAGGVAHDFNNMLEVILGHTELAMLKVNPAEPVHDDLEEIQKAARRSADLTRQLLGFARRQTVAPKVLDLNDVVAGMLKMFLRVIGEDIDLVWMPGAGLWPVKIDPSQIDQMLANLCVNARDAIAGVGKVAIETENTAFDKAHCAVHPGFMCGEYVMLAVSDDGCGMSKDVLDHLFEPFFTTKEAGKGTGLGLATVYGIVMQNEGFINVYSEPGKGSTFKIHLPRFVGQAAEPMAARAAEPPQGRGEMVLLVEDEALILNVVRTMLERLGYAVLTAGTPGEALFQARVHAAEIQLLITDMVMPEMNGRELAKLISDIKPGLRCLFTSGYSANVVAHPGVLDEGVRFLQKPFSMKDLAFEVREALEGE